MSTRIDSYRDKARRLVVGIMSGTSLDGIDVALVEISGSGSHPAFSLKAYYSEPYEPDLRQRLLAASAGESMIREAFELDSDLGCLYADAIQRGAVQWGIPIDLIDAVGLHGQTVYHAPNRRPNGVTVQLGSAAIVAERLRTIVVNDFRSMDVAAGGQGAPLVPYCDHALLHSSKVNRVALNVGGIANITWLPRNASAENLVAFDTGPGNVLIDAAMRFLFGRDYDEGGVTGGEGIPDDALLAELLDDPYYATPPPKSAGREQWGEEEGRRIAKIGLDRGLFAADIISTLVRLTARSIALGITEFAARGEQVDEVIVGGGGAHNQTLMRMLSEELPNSRIVPMDSHGISADAKEAVCFAILANECLCETPANVVSVTGASRPVVCGVIQLP